MLKKSLIFYLKRLLIPSARVAQRYTNSRLKIEWNIFNNFKIVVDKLDGFDKAEVTRGGICVDEIFPKTMECRKVPGLFFLGEALDVTGMLGGYNLHWAWASAKMFIDGL